jgi:hypothetical protein
MNNNKQSSSIDLLWEIAYNRELTVEDWKQAKAMHKEETKNAYWAGIDDHLNQNKMPNSEGYYNETFGGNNEQQ